MKNPDREALCLFAEESASRLSGIADSLEQLEKIRPVDMEVVHDIFRHTHSLKSASNLLGLRPVEQIVHKLEDVLDRIRNGLDEPDEELVDILGEGYARIGQILKNIHVVRLLDAGKDIAVIEQRLLARSLSGGEHSQKINPPR